MAVLRSYYETLYRRPVLQLSGYAAAHNLGDGLFAYLNFGGATASAKDALAEGMLALAVEKGLLSAGQTVLEATSGSFALALAIACRRSGHPLILCMPSSVEPERQAALQRMGAKIVLTDMLYRRDGAVKRAAQLAAQDGGYFLNYFDNDLNAEFHRRITGPSILKAMDNSLDAVVIGVGSGGTITGVGETVKAWVPGAKVVAVEPYESQAIGGGFVGKHTIAGIGAGFLPENYNPYIVDKVVAVTGGSAHSAAREVLFTDAVPACPSAGATLYAARRLMEEMPAEFKKVVCVFAGTALYE